ncbi:MAG TPA: TolC family protein [Saprospiraceae bacterium]|nr:TolC family protein [Saprospiraceae bacterium]
MKSIFLSIAVFVTMPFWTLASDTLTVQQCRDLALQNSPLQQKKLYAESIAALQIKNLDNNNLPRISFGGQASWQTDVIQFPEGMSSTQILNIPQDQYKVTMDVAQRIWDGGSDKYAERQRILESEIAAAQADVDVFKLREVVTDLYFRALLLQESEAILQSTKADLLTRKKQAEASVTEGVALRSTVDQVQIQILKTEQQIAATQVDKQAAMEVLAKWMDRDNTDFQLAAPVWSDEPLQPELRPEYRLFALQQSAWQIQKDRLDLSMRPRIEAFAQGGFGQPNPLNFFETGFEPYATIGLRAVWTPINWGNGKRDAQVYELQMKSVETQRDAFKQQLEASTIRDFWDLNVKYKEQLKQDASIVALQEDIVRRSDAQVKNGVMTATDYLIQINLLTQARLTQKTHELQLANAKEMLVAKIGK